MRRYLGPEGLTASPRVAVLANDALGNFVVSTPLLQMIRRELQPAELHFFGGTRTLELQAASDLIDRTYALHGRNLPATLAELPNEPFDLVINLESGFAAKAFAHLLASDETQVCGPVWNLRSDLPFPEDARGRLWADPEWIRPSLVAEYPFLRCGFIAEIFARLAFLEGDLPPYRIPMATPPVEPVPLILATSASLPEKLWPAEKWVAAVRLLHDQGIRAGLVGAPPKTGHAHWHGREVDEALLATGLVEDLRGKLTLPEVANLLKLADRALTLDNGILHMAVAAETFTVGLFRHGIHRLWTPPSERLTALVAPEGGKVADLEVKAVVEAVLGDG